MAGTEEFIKNMTQPKTPTTPRMDVGGMIESYLAGKTGSGLTNAQLEQNQLSMQNEHDIYQYKVQGMQDAGLNPALLYGQGGASSSAPAAPSNSASGLDYQGLIGALSLKANLDKTKAETNKIAEETKSEQIRREKLAQEISNLKQDLRIAIVEEGISEERKRELEIANSWADRLNEANLHYVESQSALNDATKNRINKLLKGELDIQAKTIQDFDKAWEKIDAEITKISAETNILYEDLANYALNHAQSGFFGTGLSIPNLIRLALGSKGNAGEDVPPVVVDDNNLVRRDKKGRPHLKVPGVRRGY